MPTNVTLTTRGLPTPRGPTLVDRTFQWSFIGNTLTIPKSQCGQTDFIARDGEQAAWLAQYGAAWLHGVWDCIWEWNRPGARDEFMAILAPQDPLYAEVASAMRMLTGASAAGTARAMRTLLALSQPNLAAAIPVISQLLHAANPEVQTLAAKLLYQWHRHTDVTRLPQLFRDHDPVVRIAALLQAQRECREDPSARDRLPQILERMTDDELMVRQQALQTLEVAALKGLVSSRQILELRADLGPLVGSDESDHSKALIEVADNRGPRTPWAPAMEAFYAALCEVELLRSQVEHAPDSVDEDSAMDRASTLWGDLPFDAPAEVRLYDTRIDILRSNDPTATPQDTELLRRIVMSRSPRRQFDAAAIYWVCRNTAPKALPAELVRRAAIEPDPVEPDKRDAWQRFLD